MKKTAIICLVGLVVSCAGRTDKNAAADKAAAADTAVRKTEVERVYEGVLPAADGPGIRYRLTLRNREHSGDGTYRLTMTYLEAENGKDRRFDSEGRWRTSRGSADDPDATVYQLDSGEPEDRMNFLYKSDSLVLLNDSLQRAPSGLNYTLKRIDAGASN